MTTIVVSTDDLSLGTQIAAPVISYLHEVEGLGAGRFSVDPEPYGSNYLPLFLDVVEDLRYLHRRLDTYDVVVFIGRPEVHVEALKDLARSVSTREDLDEIVLATMMLENLIKRIVVPDLTYVVDGVLSPEEQSDELARQILAHLGRRMKNAEDLAADSDGEGRAEGDDVGRHQEASPRLGS